MKKILFITGLFLGTILTFAQAPEKMSYQAIIRNASGQLLQNQSVAVKASILQGSSSGTVVYSERLTGTTNANGLLSVEIGGGTILSGTFNTINWSSGNYWLKTETDPSGGTNYSIVGTSQLLSVPYAMYAKSSGGGSSSQWTTSGNNISNSNTGNVGIGINSPSEKLEVNGSIKITDGNQALGKVLTSDATGKGNWKQLMRNEILAVSPLSFVSPNNNHKTGIVKTYFPNPISGASLTTPLHLPNGAVITKIIIHYLDNNYTKNFTFSLGKVPFGMNVFPTTVLSITPNVNQTNIVSQTITLSTPEQVNNDAYFYVFSMAGDFDTDYDGICGLQVYYSYPVNN